MNDAPVVSVIINCYNSDRFLREAIDSVYSQTYTNWELIFFDNNSSDRSAEIAKSFDNKLVYIKNEKTVPLGAARNAAISHAKGKYIALLDCDDLWLPEKLEVQLQYLDGLKISSRAVALCYTAAMRIDSSGKNLIPFAHKIKLSEGDVYCKLIKDCFISCSSALLQKSIFTIVGGFNENYHMVEELDLWLRIAKNFDVVLVDRYLTKIRMHENNQSRDFNRSFNEYKFLLQELSQRERDVSKICANKIFALGLRKICIDLFFSFDRKFIARINSFIILVLHCFRHPILMSDFIFRNFSPRIFGLMFKKFRK